MVDRTSSLRGYFPRDTNFQITMVERACSLPGHVLEETIFSKKEDPFIKIKTPFIKIKALDEGVEDVLALGMVELEEAGSGVL